MARECRVLPKEYRLYRTVVPFSWCPCALFIELLFTSPEVIGTMYRNYHRPALIITFIFPDLLPKILRTSSQGRACPTRTYACLIKHYSKQPIGAPRLNLVPATPKLYKVAFHNVLVFLS